MDPFRAAMHWPQPVWTVRNRAAPQITLATRLPRGMRALARTRPGVRAYDCQKVPCCRNQATIRARESAAAAGFPATVCPLYRYVPMGRSKLWCAEG